MRKGKVEGTDLILNNWRYTGIFMVWMKGSQREKLPE
jgi:hypothetical protein